MLPSLLFKYRGDSEKTEEIITSGNVWLSTPDKLNDPLECKTGQIPDDWKRNQIRQMEDAQMSGFVMSATPALEGGHTFYSLSSRATKRWFQGLRRLKTRKEKYGAIRSFLRDQGRVMSRPRELFERFEKQLAHVGVFSLSESPDNQLMWAHYAASHTGLAFGFKRTPKSKLGSTEHALQVVYDNVKPSFTTDFINQISTGATPDGGVKSEQKIGFADPTFRAAFSTKPVEWSYEKEWRYVEETNGLFPWPGPLETVVFGLKMPETRRKYYAALVRKTLTTPVEFFQIKATADSSSIAMVSWSSSA
jgi:hypothetical protein